MMATVAPGASSAGSAEAPKPTMGRGSRGESRAEDGEIVFYCVVSWAFFAVYTCHVLIKL